MAKPRFFGGLVTLGGFKVGKCRIRGMPKARETLATRTVTLDILVTGMDAFVYQEEIKVIEALREIPFDGHKRILGTLEAQVYFAAKDAKAPLKQHLEELVAALTHLSQADRRPRSRIADTKRVK